MASDRKIPVALPAATDTAFDFNPAAKRWSSFAKIVYIYCVLSIEYIDFIGSLHNI